jgi:hypothetical protein
MEESREERRQGGRKRGKEGRRRRYIQRGQSQRYKEGHQ